MHRHKPTLLMHTKRYTQYTFTPKGGSKNLTEIIKELHQTHAHRTLQEGVCQQHHDSRSISNECTQEQRHLIVILVWHQRRWQTSTQEKFVGEGHVPYRADCRCKIQLVTQPQLFSETGGLSLQRPRRQITCVTGSSAVSAVETHVFTKLSLIKQWNDLQICLFARFQPTTAPSYRTYMTLLLTLYLVYVTVIYIVVH